MKIRPIPVPSDTLIARYLPADYADAFRCDCPLPETITPDDVHLAFWTTAPGWVETLTRLRDRLVRPLGLTSSGNDRSARKLWVQQSITDRSTTETVIAKDDKRLRSSVRYGSTGRRETNRESRFARSCTCTTGREKSISRWSGRSTNGSYRRP